jgi:hypothetical protein
MKARICFVLVILTAVCATGRIIVPFPGWQGLSEEVPSIVVAHCERPTLPTPGVLTVNAPASDFAVVVELALKGTNSVRSVGRLLTDHPLRPGEYYLVFAHYDGGTYEAYEDYRVISLGPSFSTNSIAGKPLVEQIRTLARQSDGHLDQEIQQDQAERSRLQGLIKE